MDRYTKLSLISIVSVVIYFFLVFISNNIAPQYVQSPLWYIWLENVDISQGRLVVGLMWVESALLITSVIVFIINLILRIKKKRFDKWFFVNTLILTPLFLRFILIFILLFGFSGFVGF